MKPQDPTPEQIAAECLLIQAGWSERRTPACRLEADGSLCSRQAGFSCDYDNLTGNGDSLLQFFCRNFWRVAWGLTSLR